MCLCALLCAVVNCVAYASVCLFVYFVSRTGEERQCLLSLQRACVCSSLFLYPELSCPSGCSSIYYFG